jgi:hypothetical protein
MRYVDFLKHKSDLGAACGFAPVWDRTQTELLPAGGEEPETCGHPLGEGGA